MKNNDYPIERKLRCKLYITLVLYVVIGFVLTLLLGKECIFNCNKRFKNLWLQFFLSQNQGFMRLFEKTVLK